MTHFSAMEAVDLMTLGNILVTREKQMRKGLEGRLKKGGITSSGREEKTLGDMILLTEVTIPISESLMMTRGRHILLTNRASDPSQVMHLQFLRRLMLLSLLIFRPALLL